jgi:hypothetical protein
VRGWSTTPAAELRRVAEDEDVLPTGAAGDAAVGRRGFVGGVSPFEAEILELDRRVRSASTSTYFSIEVGIGART